MINNEINWISALPNKVQGINLILDHIYAIKRQENNWLNAAIGTKIIDARVCVCVCVCVCVHVYTHISFHVLIQLQQRFG